MLHRVSGSSPREPEVIFPGAVGPRQVRIDVRAVENIAGAAGVDDFAGGHGEGGKDARFSVEFRPQHAPLAERNSANDAPFPVQMLQHLFGRQAHLFAKPLGDNGDVGERQQLLHVFPEATAVKGRQNLPIPRLAKVVQRGIDLEAVDVNSLAAIQVQMREAVEIVLVSPPFDSALPVNRMDEGDRKSRDSPLMPIQSVLPDHVGEHPSRPIGSAVAQQVGDEPEVSATERGGNSVAAEADRVVPSQHLLVTGGNTIDSHHVVDVPVADK